MITQFFPEMSEEQRRKLVARWVTSTSSQDSKKVFGAPYLPHILNELDYEQDGKEFQKLKAEVDEAERVAFILERVGLSRSKAKHFTPKAIKALRPPGTVLTWQRSLFSFQAYFPIPQAIRTKTEEKLKEQNKKGKGKKNKRVQTHWARSRNYKEKRTKEDALSQIVNWLWKTHGEHGGESCIQGVPDVSDGEVFHILLKP